MRQIALAMILALTSLAAPARAQDGAIAGFVELADQQYARCLSVYDQGIRRGDLRFAGSNCAFDAKGIVEVAYRGTRKVVAKRPGALSMLNDFYAAWISGIDGMEPSPGETRITYSARQAATYQELKRLGARLTLE